jgi:hypothetical protein
MICADQEGADGTWSLLRELMGTWCGKIDEQLVATWLLVIIF